MKNIFKFKFLSLVLTGALVVLAGGCKEKLTDIDGNEYKTVKIGKMLWMAENLKTTKYSNGDLIETTTPADMDVSGQKEPKYQWAYKGDEKNAAIYGRLYTWYAVTDSRNICPQGWHVITDNEWNALANFYGGKKLAAGSLREVGTEHWLSSDVATNNISGFTALPGGGRMSKGIFGGKDYYGSWWSTAEVNDSTARYWNIYYNTNLIDKIKFHKSTAFSVRCVKNQ
ncbi:MAG: FISUMP domain-containing protein [Bacteroidales bacterium]|jgi:uncharacterized protein (TIGR02145 family)